MASNPAGPATAVCVCGHDRDEHSLEDGFYFADGRAREFCLECPGYAEPGYPEGQAWHKFKEAPNG